jgi:hypothetical protein
MQLRSRACLLDDLDGALRALSFACATNEALVNFDGCGFAVLNFVFTDWAGVYAGFASVAFCLVNHYFYHLFYTSVEFYQKLKRGIKAFR